MAKITRKIENLAIFSGKPAFDRTLHVGQPNLGNREKLLERINTMFDRKRLTNRGPFVEEFEREVAAIAGVKHCISMCNGTVALEIAIRALGMKGEVILPSFTFIADAHALQWQQIKPVFCDINPQTHQIDPTKIEELITPNTTGIIGVHLWARPAEIDQITEIAQRNNLKLLFDAAHAFGASYKGKMIGSFGDAEVFSFHATKYLNSFEGGAVVTNNDQLAEKIRLMQNFGFAGKDNVIYIGINGKMNEASAAMGLTSIESRDEFTAINKENYLAYKKEFSAISAVRLLPYNITEKSNYQYIVLEIDEKKSGISRDKLMKILHAENIIARRYFYPGCHRMEPYRSYQPHAGLLLPQTEKLSANVLTLPSGKNISTEDISKICSLINMIIENSDKLNI